MMNNPKRRIVDNILELVGDTPLVRINRMNPAPDVRLLVKLESMNPGGSVKDRIGLRMIEDADYRPRQFPFTPEAFCVWGAKPDIPEFQD